MALGADLRLPRPAIATAESTKQDRATKTISIAHAKLLIAPDSLPIVAASFVPGEAKLARQFDLAESADQVSADARFDAVRSKAGLNSQKLAGFFHHSSAKSARPVQTAEVPALERFGGALANAQQTHGVMLAYATPGEDGSAVTAFSALLSEPDSEDEEIAALPDDSAPESDVPNGVFDETPDDGPLPQLRPSQQPALKPLGAAKQVEPDDQAEPQDDEEKTAKPAVRPSAKPRSLAYARPEEPAERGRSGGLGQSLRSLFGGRAKAGNGVAVYDISAAKVYMPDGSVLEAHSGVGRMADNARYVDVKMGGPTPPHTYNLKMRERLFHGVEAIRMLPVDGKNKYGRDGFLTHSYLLRGGRAESHGCVAFKDYSRFLKAYKQGKVRQIVVVPSGGRAAGVRMASNG